MQIRRAAVRHLRVRPPPLAAHRLGLRGVDPRAGVLQLLERRLRPHGRLRPPLHQRRVRHSLPEDRLRQGTRGGELSASQIKDVAGSGTDT